MNGRFARAWVAGFIALLAVFGFGQLESWPFTSWYMFSGVERATVEVARAVAVSPNGVERVLGSEALPQGLLSHRLLQRFAGGTEAEREQLCERLLVAARATGPAGFARVDVVRWNVLDRLGDRPRFVDTTVVRVCR